MRDYSLYLVTDETLAGPRGVEAVVRAAVEGGVSVVQLRAKEAAGRTFLEQARRLGAWLHDRRIPLIINDRVDIALACGADGVHVGQDDLPCPAVRLLVGPHRLVGVSVSSVAEALRAEREGADYLGVSPIFATLTKPDAPPATGLDGLTAIRAAVHLPLIAIGGISEANAAAVIRAGADGLAVVSAIMAAPDPAAAARRLRKCVEAARGRV